MNGGALCLFLPTRATPGGVTGRPRREISGLELPLRLELLDAVDGELNGDGGQQ
jgi:hypothetical protein